MKASDTILLVEDEESDAFFFKRALQKNNLQFRVQVAQNGQVAVNYMKGEGEFADREQYPFPTFIITDNRMPTMSGNDFLKWLKANPQFRVIPTIVFGGSSSPADISNAYENLDVNSYIVKPSNADELEKVVKIIFDYWSICTFPTEKGI